MTLISITTTYQSGTATITAINWIAEDPSTTFISSNTILSGPETTSATDSSTPTATSSPNSTQSLAQISSPSPSSSPSSSLSSSLSLSLSSFSLSTLSASTTSTTRNDSSTPTQVVQVTGGPVPVSGIAGISIGMVILGAFLALLAIWALGRKKRFGAGEANQLFWTKVYHHPNNDEKGTGPRNDITLEENLLERADDSDIRKSMQDLNEFIDQHCVNYYHLRKLNINQGDLENRLVECGYDSSNTSGPSVAEFSRLLQNPKTRIAAIHRLISQLVLSHAEWKSKSDVSLLPSYITNFCQSIPPVESHPGSEEVFEKAFTEWRHLSAFLLQPVRSNRRELKANEQELEGAINRNIASLNKVLSPFIKPDLDNQRHRQDNLGAIIFAGAQLGLLLFSQPFDWRMSWEPASSRTDSFGRGKPETRVTITEVRGQETKVRTLVTFPAIEERIDNNGARRIRVIAHCVEVEV